MSTFKEWRNVWKLLRQGTLFNAVNSYIQESKKWKEELELQAQLVALGLPREIRIGAMLRTASDYRIKLDLGMTAYDCRAILDKEYWVKPLDRTRPLEAYAFFLIPQSYDAITDFQGIDYKVEFAIAKCLIAARTAGVI